MSTENETTTEKKEDKKFNWKIEILRAVINAIGFGLVLLVLKHMGWV